VTSLHQKAGNTYSYVPWSSTHPVSVKTAWVKAEMIRHKIICSNELVYNEVLTAFIERLVGRGYPRHVLAMLERDVAKRARSSILYPSGQDSGSAPLIMPAHCDNIWYNVSTRQLERLLQPTLNDMLRSSPCGQQVGNVIKSLRCSDNIADFTSAVNKIITTCVDSYTVELEY